jgi:hypothetical protein
LRCDNVNECGIVLSVGETVVYVVGDGGCCKGKERALEINVRIRDKLVVVVVLTEGVEKDVLGVV